MAVLSGIRCVLSFSFFLVEKCRFYKDRCTPIRLLTLYMAHATMRKITYDWVRCL